MKLHRLLVLLPLLSTATCYAQAPKTKDDFLAAVRSAYNAKDIKRIHELTWEEGMSDFDRKQQDQMLPMILSQSSGIDSASFQPLPADFGQAMVAFGRRLEPTHSADGMVSLALKSKVPNSSSSMSIPYALIDGAYYLVSGKSTDLGWKGPPDHSLNVLVMGPGQDKVKIHVKYNASGVNLERFESGGFPGQYIGEVVVKSDSDDVDVTLSLIDEHGTTYYKSLPLKGKGEIDYHRGDKGSL